jgi:hypothetical protein
MSLENYTHTEVERQIADALNAGDVDGARTLLRGALINQPTAITFFYASRAAVNNIQRVEFLQKAIEIDPFFVPAVNELETIRSATTPTTTPNNHAFSSTSTVSETVPCPRCNGSGTLSNAQCQFCQGVGRVGIEQARLANEQRKVVQGEDKILIFVGLVIFILCCFFMWVASNGGI